MGGGGNVLQPKNGEEGQPTTHKIRYNQRKITSIVNLLIKA